MWRFVLVSSVVGCAGDDGDPDGPTGAVDPFDQFVNVTVPATGDFSCFTPTADPAAAAWLVSAPDPALQLPYTVNGVVEDFQEGTPVGGATVSLYGGDVVSGAPDATASADVSGVVSLEATACAPLTYKVAAQSDPIATRTTYKAHQVYGAPAGGAIDGASFVSVSDVTYQLIPGILGIDVQPGLAVIAGTAYDCSRDPSQVTDDPLGKVEGVQVVVYDADGNIPDTMSVDYFVQQFPAEDQAYTSADGLWVAANVPPGDLHVEMWGDVGGALVLLGATDVRSEADSINIANVFAGYGDGVKVPASCEAP
ncbi:MAG: hypothetical protein ABMA64_33185 [Myxococcota bacterium]